MISFLPLGGANEIGANCYYLNFNGNGILLDCGIHPKKTGSESLPLFNLLEKKPLDHVIITHAHQDHILDAEAIAKNNNATIVSNYEIANHYEAKGIEVHPMNHGGNWDFEFGKVKYVNAIHTSSFPDGSYGGQPGGFVIEGEHKNIAFVFGVIAFLICSGVTLKSLSIVVSMITFLASANFTNST